MILSILVANAAVDNGMRYVLLTLIFVAVILLFAGAIIAIMTFLGQRKRSIEKE